jgi:hypothetical protein
MDPKGYFALVLTRDASKQLASSLATLPVAVCDHCTVCYGTDDIHDLPPFFSETDLGKPFRLKVIGFATRDDGGIQAAPVALVGHDGQLQLQGFSTNPIPHITVATDGKAEAVESNALLAKGFSPLDGPYLDATLQHTFEELAG